MTKFFLYYTNFELPFDGERLDEDTLLSETSYLRDDLVSVFDSEEDARAAMDSYVSYADLKDAYGWNKKIWCGKLAFVVKYQWDCECSEEDDEYEDYEEICTIMPSHVKISQPFASPDLDRTNAYKELEQEHGKVELYGATYYLMEDIPEGDGYVDALYEDEELYRGTQTILCLQCKDGKVVDWSPFNSGVITWDDDGTFSY